MAGNMVAKAAVAVLLVLSFGVSNAVEIPKASSKALGVTKGRQFDAGLVFINGKFIEPPYVVERRGVGICINGMPAVGQVIEWAEFLKTQQGVKVVKTETPAPAYVPPASEPETPSYDDVDSSLDDLFDDEPKVKKKPHKPAAKRPSYAPRKPTTTVTYTLEGEFVPNATTKTLVSRINAVRTEIDRILRSGGFICFGDRYARVSGDQRAAMIFLDKIPEIMRRSETPDAFRSSVRSANLVYLTDAVCNDLFRNRIDYRKLQDRRRKWKDDLELKKLMKGVGDPIF